MYIQNQRHMCVLSEHCNLSLDFGVGHLFNLETGERRENIFSYIRIYRNMVISANN